MLEWLESSWLARLVQESAWGYPITLSAHAVGMAVLAGIILMINFRVLGIAPAVPMAALRPMYRVALAGVVINVVSGLMLFVSNADAFWVSTPFWIKISLLVVGSILMVMMARRLFEPLAEAGVSAGPQVRLLAQLSTIAWLGVIVMGRLIAYWDWKEF